MDLTPRKPAKEARLKIQKKLGLIEEQAKQIQSMVTNLVDEVLSPVKDAKELLQEKSKRKFFADYPQMNQALEGCLDKLLLIRNALATVGAESESTDEESEDDEDDYNIDDNISEVSTSLSVTDQNTRYEENSKKQKSQTTGNADKEQAESTKGAQQQISSMLEERLTIKSLQDTSHQTVETNACNSDGEKRIHNLVFHNSSESEPLVKTKPECVDPNLTDTSIRGKAPNRTIPCAKRKALTSCSSPLPYPWNPNKSFPVVVTAVTSPWDLCLQAVKCDYDEMMEELCLLFAKESSLGYRGGINHVPAVGAYCCAKSPIDKMWYRAVVRGVKKVETPPVRKDSDSDSQLSMEDPVLANIDIQVFFIDDGTTAHVPISHLRPLEEKFSQLPCQAIQCMLGGVSPFPIAKGSDLNIKAQSKQWSIEATDWLSDMVKSERHWTAYITPFLNKEKFYHVVDLYVAEDVLDEMGVDSRPPLEQNVAYMMLQVGFAHHCSGIFSHLNKHSKEIEGLFNDVLFSDVLSSTLVEPICNSQEDKQREEVNQADGQSSTSSLPKFPLDEPLSDSNLLLMKYTYRNKYYGKPSPENKSGFFQVLVAGVENPGLFYVHQVTPDVVEFDAFMDKLQSIYNALDGVPSVVHGKLDIGSAVVAQFSEDDKWYRGLVIDKREASHANVEYYVFHVDFGSKEWVDTHMIRPIAEDFFDLPVEVMSCTLAGIEPITSCTSDNTRDKPSSANNDDLMPSYVITRAAGDEYKTIVPNLKANSSRDSSSWSKQAKQAFRKLTLHGRPLIAARRNQGSSTDTDTNTGPFDCTTDPFPIYLYDTSGEVDVLINDELVNRGYAKRCKMEDQNKKRSSSMSSPQSPVSPTTLFEKWNPMEDEFLSQRNAYKVNTDDPGVMSVGYEEPRRNICKYFLSGKRCYRGNECIYEHSRPENPPDTLMEVFCDKLYNIADVPDPGTWVLVHVTSCFDPAHFWVRFPLGTKSVEEIMKEVGLLSPSIVNEGDELEALQEELNAHYSAMPFQNKDLVTYAIGEVIAARYSEDLTWYRAKVVALIRVDDKVSFRVFFVDYGNTDTVSEDDTRALEPQFLQLPFQAVECFLMNTQVPDNIRENTENMKYARECFNEYVQDKVLVARIMSRAVNKTLGLELYDTSSGTPVSIRESLLKACVVSEISGGKHEPWDMSCAIAVNPKIVHMIPG